MHLKLETIANRLAGLEETIIHKLLDRAQYLLNPGAYSPGDSGFVPQETASFFELRLLYQENLEAVFGRFQVPEERPFYQGLPQPKRLPPLRETGLVIRDLEVINLSGKILVAYMDVLPQLCQAGEDREYGSAVEHDVISLQAIASRIHYGSLYVAESKYQEHQRAMDPLIDRSDEEGLKALITRAEVEERILERVRKKVHSIQSLSDPHNRILVEPQVIVDFFRDWVIPLTKEGEIRYLLQRPASVLALQH